MDMQAEIVEGTGCSQPVEPLPVRPLSNSFTTSPQTNTSIQIHHTLCTSAISNSVHEWCGRGVSSSTMGAYFGLLRLTFVANIDRVQSYSGRKEHLKYVQWAEVSC